MTIHMCRYFIPLYYYYIFIIDTPPENEYGKLYRIIAFCSVILRNVELLRSKNRVLFEYASI